MLDPRHPGPPPNAGAPPAPAGDLWSSGAIVEVILDHLSDAVFATDLDNRVTFWGPSAARLFGYSAAEAVGRPFGELLPYRMAADGDADAFVATLRAGRTWRGSGSVRLRDGTERWIESTVQPVRVEGRVIGSVSVSRDMTARRDAEHRLIAQERFLDAVLEVMGTIVSVLDAQGRIVRVNRAAQEVSRRAPAELVGRPLWEVLIPPSEVARVRERFARLTAGDYPSAFENHWVTATGEERLIHWSNTCLTDAAGAVTHVIGAGIDITEARRSRDALDGIEAVGQLVASAGPTDAALDAVTERLATRMGYRYVTLILRDGPRWRLGAQRGYLVLPAIFDPARGVIGRVIRTGAPAFVGDVLADPDYVADDPLVRSELCVPLRAEDATLGVLDIEARAEAPLTEDDLRLALTVADRLAAALLLGREQLALRERVRLFGALTEFARQAGLVRDPEQLWPALAAAAAGVIAADIVSLTTLDRASGQYVLRAVAGASETLAGTPVPLGEGAAGRAMAERAVVILDALPRERFAAPLQPSLPADAMVVLAVPLLREGAVLGAVAFARPAEHGFSPLEQEVAALLGAQAALAVANAHLLEEVSELAIHDPLTGLFNRRHFDAALELMVARWRRDRGRTALAAVMLDLDHFGDFNRAHGHQTGDAALRLFAGVLRERVRSSDLVARYGGEEFVVVLEGCDRDGALAVAEGIRATFAQREIPGPEGTTLHATVSAGCAVLSPDAPSAEALIRSADVALFMAKRAGRDQVVAV
jgi:diguanylate cyclase (GGDEF)-like protein/PAS domain S-box-containing protein